MVQAEGVETPSRRRGPEWIVWAAFLALSARLYARVSSLAVDLPFWDQWDFWNPFFSGAGPWTFFRWQHGPQWQGLGGLVLWASGRASGLSIRTEAFVSTTIVVAGAAVFLLFVRRVRGRLDALDVVLPLVLLNGLHADAIVNTPNPAHGPVPFALLCAAPACAAVRRDALRLPLLVALAGLATHTGFTYLLVPPLVALLLVDLLHAAPGTRTRHALAPAAAALAGASYLAGFVPTSAVGCFQFPDPQPWRYFPFAAGVLGRPFGPLRALPIPIAVAIFATVAVLAVALWGARAALRRRGDDLGRAAFLLCGFASLFAASTAIGRACLGLGSANAERYVPYVLPALATAYAVLRARARVRPDLAACAAGLLVLVAEGRQAVRPSAATLTIAEGKRRFLACVQAGGDAARCTGDTGFEIYPRPEATGLEAKLRFLRDRRLGPFRPP